MTKKVKFYKLRVFFFPIFKRLLDLIGSLVLAIVFFIPTVIIATLIKLTSPGPILFRQNRVGKDSQPFKMYKFRTMYHGDNDKRLKKYPKLWKKYKQNDWKLSINEDPRITPIGKFVRMTSLDELPQIINVLKGNMTLVGPRAYREAELREYAQKYPESVKYINIIRTAKPGITGLWQTSGRNDLSFINRAKMDAHYINRRSFRKELSILFKTPFCMLSRW